MNAERNRRKHAVRAHTIEARRIRSGDGPELPRSLPQVREDCLPGGRNAARPCPFVSCRHHLYLDVSDIGSIKLNFPDLEPDQLGASCSLDLAEEDGMTLHEVGAAMNITRERVRQIENDVKRQLLPMLRRGC